MNRFNMVLKAKKYWISSFMQPTADKGKNSLFLNAASGRRGRVSFLLHHSIYQARYGEQVCSNLKRVF